MIMARFRTEQRLNKSVVHIALLQVFRTHERSLGVTAALTIQ